MDKVAGRVMSNNEDSSKHNSNRGAGARARSTRYTHKKKAPQSVAKRALMEHATRALGKTRKASRRVEQIMTPTRFAKYKALRAEGYDLMHNAAKLNTMGSKKEAAVLRLRAKERFGEANAIRFHKPGALFRNSSNSNRDSNINNLTGMVGKLGI
jgi:hypothetical protein